MITPSPAFAEALHVAVDACSDAQDDERADTLPPGYLVLAVMAVSAQAGAERLGPERCAGFLEGFAAQLRAGEALLDIGQGVGTRH